MREPPARLRSGRRGRVLAITLVPVLPFLAAACRTYDGSIEVVPIFQIHDGPAATAGAGRTVAGEEEGVEAQRSREIILRPLGSVERIGNDPGRRRTRVKVLWPLGDYAWGQGNTRLWTIPLFYYRSRPIDAEIGAPRGRDVDWMLFPVFLGGNDPREGSYFGVFPLGGTARGLFAKDETHFILFPLYLRWWEGEYDSMHILFPFFNRVQGAGHRGWRVWPFYGSYSADRVVRSPETGEETVTGPRYRRRFIMWPLYIHGQENLDSARPTTTFLSIPFYGHSSNSHTEVTTVLWPFFHVARDRATGHRLWFGYLIPYRFTGGQFDPWPLFGWKTRVTDIGVGRDTRGIAGPGGVDPGQTLEDLSRLRPSSLNTRFRQFAIWPIERYEVDEGDTWLRTKLWILPVFWHFHTIDKDRFETSAEWKVWPLVRYRRDGGRSSLYFPSPFWFRQENLFERLYARLWRLFLYENTPERRGWELLYGLLSYRHEKPAHERTVSILYGLLEWGHGPEGHRFRLLYLPWR